MNRKRILIVNNNMHIGGVQKALANLLCEIHSDYDITLLLFYKGGELLKDVPPDVKVMDAAAPFRYLGMSKSDAVRVGDKLFRFFFAAFTRIFGMRAAVKLMGLTQKRYAAITPRYHFCTAEEKKFFMADATSLCWILQRHSRR